MAEADIQAYSEYSHLILTAIHSNLGDILLSPRLVSSPSLANSEVSHNTGLVENNLIKFKQFFTH